MKTTKIKPQLIVITGGLILLAAPLAFGKTVKTAEKKPEAPMAAGSLSAERIVSDYKSQLPPTQLAFLNKLESNNVSNGDRSQQIHHFHEIANFWRDSVQAFEPYAYYLAEAAKLENSEKSLTFAAHLLESRLIDEGSPALQTWLASNAKELFEKALAINPNNDSTKIGLGACYIFGNISNNPMQGILPITEITKKDPNNSYAQKVLAMGGLKTGQFDKAIERLNIVLKNEPDNLEIVFRLAEAYERKGDKTKAIAQYERLKTLINIPQAKDDIQHRIEELKK